MYVFTCSWQSRFITKLKQAACTVGDYNKDYHHNLNSVTLGTSLWDVNSRRFPFDTDLKCTKCRTDWQNLNNQAFTEVICKMSTAWRNRDSLLNKADFKNIRHEDIIWKKQRWCQVKIVTLCHKKIITETANCFCLHSYAVVMPACWKFCINKFFLWSYTLLCVYWTKTKSS